MAARQRRAADLPVLTESEIAELQRETLELQRNAIVSDVDPRRHFSYLRSQLVMDADDQELIMSEKTRKERCEAFLDILSKRGSRGFRAFQDSLVKDKVQIHILQGINEKFEELLQRLREKKAVGEQDYSPEPPPYSELPEINAYEPVQQVCSNLSVDLPVPETPPFSAFSVKVMTMSQPCTDEHEDDRTVVSSLGERVESMNQKC